MPQLYIKTLLEFTDVIVVYDVPARGVRYNTFKRNPETYGDMHSFMINVYERSLHAWQHF